MIDAFFKAIGSVLGTVVGRLIVIAGGIAIIVIIIAS